MDPVVTDSATVGPESYGQRLMNPDTRLVTFMVDADTWLFFKVPWVDGYTLDQLLAQLDSEFHSDGFVYTVPSCDATYGMDQKVYRVRTSKTPSDIRETITSNTPEYSYVEMHDPEDYDEWDPRVLLSATKME